jgi:BirA family transcriptional regulator, biotin operon repressor / biotin---[acetyl-CoA-carboxylase] ligase
MTHIQHHLNWGAEALWQQLEPLLPGISVEVLARVESTNTRLLERARADSGQRDAPITRPGDLDTLARNSVVGDLSNAPRNSVMGDLSNAPRDTVAGELAAADGSQARTRHGRRQADVSPCLLVAEEQTRGRGRLGRGWVSSTGASLTFSLAVPLAPAQWGGLSLAVGLALADALDPADAGNTAPRLMLKWPNDLWLADGPATAGGQPGRKLGGILIETITVGEHRLCVVGVGLNVAPQPAAAAVMHTIMPLAENNPTPFAHGYACLQELHPGLTAPATLALVAAPLVRALKQFEKHGFAPLVAGYSRRDMLRGRAVSATSSATSSTTSSTGAPQAMDGVAEGVDEQGALRLRSDGLHRVVSGEVSVRLQAVPNPQIEAT